jgi:predicted PurR-regulated permease PerM
MKYLKIYFLVLLLLVLLLPVGVFGYFAEPDDNTYSSSFGVQNPEFSASSGTILPSANQIDSDLKNAAAPNNNIGAEQAGQGQGQLSHNINTEQMQKNLNVFYSFLTKNITIVIFTAAIVILTLIFLFLKFKKML